MRVRMCVRVCACVCMCVHSISGQIVIRTHDHDQHTRPTHQRTPTEHTLPKKRGTTATREKPVYICMIAATEKKV